MCIGRLDLLAKIVQFLLSTLYSQILLVVRHAYTDLNQAFFYHGIGECIFIKEGRWFFKEVFFLPTQLSIKFIRMWLQHIFLLLYYIKKIQ